MISVNLYHQSLTITSWTIIIASYLNSKWCRHNICMSWLDKHLFWSPCTITIAKNASKILNIVKNFYNCSTDLTWVHMYGILFAVVMWLHTKLTNSSKMGISVIVMFQLTVSWPSNLTYSKTRKFYKAIPNLYAYVFLLIFFQWLEKPGNIINTILCCQQQQLNSMQTYHGSTVRLQAF